MSANAVMSLAQGDPVVSNAYGLTSTNMQIGYGGIGGYAGGSYSNCLACYHYPCSCHTTVITTRAETIPDKTKVAFGVAKKLIKSKFFKAEKIQEFVELVEMIEKEL
jgi:hypothetical protein